MTNPDTVHSADYLRSLSTDDLERVFEALRARAQLGEETDDGWLSRPSWVDGDDWEERTGKKTTSYRVDKTHVLAADM
jgi:hypothetical protein